MLMQRALVLKGAMDMRNDTELTEAGRQFVSSHVIANPAEGVIEAFLA